MPIIIILAFSSVELFAPDASLSSIIDDKGGKEESSRALADAYIILKNEEASEARLQKVYDSWLKKEAAAIRAIERAEKSFLDDN